MAGLSIAARSATVKRRARAEHKLAGGCGLPIAAETRAVRLCFLTRAALAAAIAFVLLAAPAGAAERPSIAAEDPLQAPPVCLGPAYQALAEAPCQFVGFSFEDSWDEMLQMRRIGAEICGLNRMWLPVPDPEAPYGCGYWLGPYMVKTVEQRFRLDARFSAIGLVFPTDFLAGSATVELFRLHGGRRLPVARRRFENVPDGFFARLEFPPQPPGEYLLRVGEAEGSIGVWITPSRIEGAKLFIDGRRWPGAWLEFAHIDPSGRLTWHSDPSNHFRVKLGPRSFARKVDEIAAAGMKAMIWVGNWNNGAFPYYPDWFFKRFPDLGMLDARGRPILAGMFGARKPWPSIEHPAIVSGTSRYIRAVVRRHRDADNLVYWALGGEALYPTYAMPEVGWADYSPNAIAHFRAWLKRRYGTLQRLNSAWGTRLSSFAEANPPRRRELSRRFYDWLDFRFSAMAERMAWHWAAVRSEDPARPALTTNHGNIFWGQAFAALGADLALYDDASDGFELGHIIHGSDPGYLNLLWAAAVRGFGKLAAPARLAYRLPDPTARGGGRSFTPEAVRRYCMEALGCGFWHLGLIQWRGSLPDGEWGIKGTAALGEVRRVFADLKKLRRLAWAAWPLRPLVAVYLSRPRWAMLGWHPDWTALHVWLVQHQIDYEILWDEQLLAGAAEGYRAIICPHAELISPGALRALRDYAARGGRLVIIGKFAQAGPGGESLPEEAARPSGPGVLRLAGDVGEALPRLEELLGRLGVRPFCRIEADGSARWLMDLEPLHGRHDLSPRLSPNHVFSQTFSVPGTRVLHVAFRTPTYEKRPRGVGLKIRLRRGGPGGPVVAEGTVPADRIRDNAWAGIDMDVPVRPGETMAAEVQLERPAADAPIGVWALSTSQYSGGEAYTDGRRQDFDFEIKVRYEAETPARWGIEAFVLSDGANFLVPLINASRGDIELRAEVAGELLAARPEHYRTYEALTGQLLGRGPGARVSVPAHGYRVLWVRRAATSQQARAAVERAETLLRRTSRGRLPRFHRACIQRARRALDEWRPEKALAFALRAISTPLVFVNARRDSEGLHVRARAFLADGRPLSGASAWLQAIPIPGARAAMEEVGPGEYRTHLPARLLQAYDYPRRRYSAYRGPLRVVVTVQRGRLVGQEFVDIR